jgi:hypothetical protein
MSGILINESLFVPFKEGCENKTIENNHGMMTSYN